jgi:HEAT repeat protein
MRYLLFIVLLVTLGGCNKTQPTMAGHKWAEALRDPDAKVRQKAAFTLGNIGPSDAAALPALIGALNDAEAGVRCEVILAIIKFGSKAKEARSVLASLCENDPDSRVREYATRAIRRIEEGG